MDKTRDMSKRAHPLERGGSSSLLTLAPLSRNLDSAPWSSRSKASNAQTPTTRIENIPGQIQPSRETFPTDSRTSLRSLPYHKPAADIIDSALKLARQVVLHLDNTVRGTRNALLSSVMIDICNISGILSHLRLLIEHSDSEYEWTSIELRLPRPLEQYTRNLVILATNYAPNVHHRPDSNQQRLSEVRVNVMDIKFAVEKLKAVFIAALQNDTKLMGEKSAVLLSQIERQPGSENAKFHAVGQREKVVQWLLRNGVSAEHNEAAKIIEPGTGDWFIQSLDFQTWREDPHTFLWLHGIAGSGKTIICATIVEHLKRTSKETDRIACFYFDSRIGVSGDSAACLRSLIAQLSMKEKDVPVAVQKLFDHHAFGDTLPNNLELVYVLLSLIRRHPRTFIIVDAVDEASSTQEVLEALEIIVDAKMESLHFLVSSRLLVEINERLKPISTATIALQGRSVDDDISLYIQHRIQGNPLMRKWEESLKREVSDALTNGAQGMFHWAASCLHMLGCLKTTNEVKYALKSLPKSLDLVYFDLLSKVPKEYAAIAKNAFQWLAFSERPLYIEELAEAAILNQERALNPDDRFGSPYDIVDVCSGLVKINDHAGDEHHKKQVIFAHYTVKEYLLSPLASRTGFSFLEIDAQRLISHVSLSYLLSFTQAGLETENDSVSFPLLEYVTKYWYNHVKAVSKNCELTDSIATLAIQLFDSKSTKVVFNGSNAATSDTVEGPEAVEKSRGFLSSLYYASLLGLTDIVRRLLNRGDDVEQVGGFCGRALEAAAYSGNETVMTYLLSRGAVVTNESGHYGSALQVAAHRGHRAISQLLLEYGANVDCTSGCCGNALQVAAIGGYVDLVQLLIEYRADVNSLSGPYGTALIAACYKGHRDVVLMLVENGAYIEEQDSVRRLTALYAAAASGHCDVVRLLLDSGADINRRTGEYGGVLGAAVHGGYDDVVELLVRRGADINLEDPSGSDIIQSLLHTAAERGYDGVIQLLVQRDAEVVNMKDRQGIPLLTKVVMRKSARMVQFLLENGASTEATDANGNTALSAAVQDSHDNAIVRLLLESGAQISAMNRLGRIALDQDVARRLLLSHLRANDLDLNHEGGYGGTHVKQLLIDGYVREHVMRMLKGPYSRKEVERLLKQHEESPEEDELWSTLDSPDD